MNEVASSNKKTIADVMNKKSFKLPAVVPIVLYNGAEPWTASRNLRDCIVDGDLFGKSIIDFEYILVDVKNYTKEDLVEQGDAISAVFLLDQKTEPEEFIIRTGLAPIS